MISEAEGRFHWTHKLYEERELIKIRKEISDTENKCVIEKIDLIHEFYQVLGTRLTYKLYLFMPTTNNGDLNSFKSVHFAVAGKNPKQLAINIKKT